MSFYLGEDLVSLDDVLGEIRSSFVKEGIAVLKNRLNEDGYLCLRNLIPQKNVIAARKIIYENLKENGSFSNSSTFDPLPHHPLSITCFNKSNSSSPPEGLKTGKIFFLIFTNNN